MIIQVSYNGTEVIKKYTSSIVPVEGNLVYFLDAEGAAVFYKILNVAYDGTSQENQLMLIITDYTISAP